MGKIAKFANDSYNEKSKYIASFQQLQVYLRNQAKY